MAQVTVNLYITHKKPQPNHVLVWQTEIVAGTSAISGEVSLEPWCAVQYVCLLPYSCSCLFLNEQFQSSWERCFKSVFEIINKATLMLNWIFCSYFRSMSPCSVTTSHKPYPNTFRTYYIYKAEYIAELLTTFRSFSHGQWWAILFLHVEKMGIKINQLKLKYYNKTCFDYVWILHIHTYLHIQLNHRDVLCIPFLPSF